MTYEMLINEHPSYLMEEVEITPDEIEQVDYNPYAPMPYFDRIMQIRAER
jgi:hypothetical protein